MWAIFVGVCYIAIRKGVVELYNTLAHKRSQDLHSSIEET